MFYASNTQFWRSRGGIALLGLLAVAAAYLLTEHIAHVLARCPSCCCSLAR